LSVVQAAMQCGAAGSATTGPAAESEIFWTTDDFPERDRFERWSEARAQLVYATVNELDRQARRSFRASLRARDLGPASAVELRASYHRISRSRHMIERDYRESFCIFQQLDGSRWFDNQHKCFDATSGSVITAHADLPFQSAPHRGAPFHFRVVKLPFVLFEAHVRHPGVLIAQCSSREPAYAALLSAYLDHFVGAGSALDAEACAATAFNLGVLALVARGAVGPRSEAGKTAIQAAQIERAQQLIARDFASSAFSASAAAAALGLSLRQLQGLLEPTGMSFSEHLSARRLDRARHLLTGDRRPVAAVAAECGYDGVSTFYREFRADTGLTPADYRTLFSRPETPSN
jgi:AraC-like DNA-binding protein